MFSRACQLFLYKYLIRQYMMTLVWLPAVFRHQSVESMNGAEDIVMKEL